MSICIIYSKLNPNISIIIQVILVFVFNIDLLYINYCIHDWFCVEMQMPVLHA